MKFDIGNHKRKFPNACMAYSNKWLYGFWVIGNMYKAPNDYYGEYPPSYIERVMSLFPLYTKILHLFSGAVSPDKYPGTTLDINPNLNPDICANAEKLSNALGDRRFDLIMADPPYTVKDAREYGRYMPEDIRREGTKMPNKLKVTSECRKVISDNGVLVWLDTRKPMYRKIHWRYTGLIAVDCGTNRAVRGAWIFEPA